MTNLDRFFISSAVRAQIRIFEFLGLKKFQKESKESKTIGRKIGSKLALLGCQLEKNKSARARAGGKSEKIKYAQTCKSSGKI